MLQTLKLNSNKKRKKSLYYKENSLVGLTPDLISAFYYINFTRLFLSGQSLKILQQNSEKNVTWHFGKYPLPHVSFSNPVLTLPPWVSHIIWLTPIHYLGIAIFQSNKTINKRSQSIIICHGEFLWHLSMGERNYSKDKNCRKWINKKASFVCGSFGTT